MSNIDENGELEKKISISAEDVDNVLNYSVNFGVEISSGLKLAMDKFNESPTYENMLDFKLEICKWLHDSKHESFADSLWDHPKDAAKDIMYDLQFDKEVREELSDDDKN